MTLVHPIWAIVALLTLPTVLLFTLWRQRRTRHLLSSWVTEKLHIQATRSISPVKLWLRSILLAIGLSLGFFTLAQPQWGHTWVENPHKGLDILLALDTSKSMLAEDLKPNRLERARLNILELLKKAEGDRIGLIAFSGSAFLQCPLTLDYDAFEQTVDEIDTETIPVGGTNIAAAISEARAILNRENSHKLLILITDGEDLEGRGIQEARKAADEGITIFTVGIGSDQGELIPLRQADGSTDFAKDPDGNLVRTKLDPETLKAIAQATKGQYTPMGDRLDTLTALHSFFQETIENTEKEVRRRKIPIERYHGFLAGSLFFLILEMLIGNRRMNGTVSKTISSVLLVTMLSIFSSPKLQAGLAQEGFEAFNRGDYEKAAESWQKAVEKDPEDARLFFNLGTALHAHQKHAEALEAFQQALNTPDITLQADVYYNRALCFAALGAAQKESAQKKTRKQWTLAIKEIDQSLALRPDDVEAQQNRETLRKLLQELPQYTLRLEPDPMSSGSVEGGGVYDRGESIKIRAIPEVGYAFVRWEGAEIPNATKAETTVKMEQDLNLKALFAVLVPLTLTAVPAEGGNVEKSGSYPEGEPVTIKAVSAWGYRFVRWEGAAFEDAEKPETTLKLTEPTTVNAIFEPAFELEIEQP
jgi:Ca-activated chloride channel family protein